MINFKSKLSFQYFGGGIALSASGPAEQITQDLNCLFNYGAHNDETVFLSENFGYVLTTKDKLIKGLTNLQMAPTYTAFWATPRGEERAEALNNASRAAEVISQKFVDSLPLEHFLDNRPAILTEYSIPFK